VWGGVDKDKKTSAEAEVERSSKKSLMTSAYGFGAIPNHRNIF